MSIGQRSETRLAIKPRRRPVCLGLALFWALGLSTLLGGCAGPARLPTGAGQAPDGLGTTAGSEDAIVTVAELDSQELADRLRAADRAQRDGNYPDAIDGYERVLSRFKTSTPTVETIRSSLMEAQYLARLYDDALETSQEILDGDPSAETIKRALERRYEIGRGFLNGATRRVLGLAVSAEGRGLEILDDLVERYPFQEFADDAVYHIASWYLGREDYAEAEQLFQRLLRDYPTSQWSATAEYRIGEAALKRLKGVEYDFGTLESAERRFKRYLKLNPAGDQAARARESLAEIERLLARRWLAIAEFYIDFQKEDAAQVYLRKLRENYPQTEEGRRATALLENLGSGTDATP